MAGFVVIKTIGFAIVLEIIKIEMELYSLGTAQVSSNLNGSITWFMDQVWEVIFGSVCRLSS